MVPGGPEELETPMGRMRVSSSGEESEDNDKRPLHSRSGTPCKESATSNWSPRMALRHLSSFRRKSREAKRKNSGGARSYSFTSPTAQTNSSPSRNSLPRRKSRSSILSEAKSSSTTSPAPPIRIATRSGSPSEAEDLISPRTEECVSVSASASPTNKSDTTTAADEKAQARGAAVDSPLKDKGKAEKERSSSKESLVIVNSEETEKPVLGPATPPPSAAPPPVSTSAPAAPQTPAAPVSTTATPAATPTPQEETPPTKRDIKLAINARRFSENPKKSLSRSGLSPGTLKKAFQFTRSASWTQKKFAMTNASPPCLSKLAKQEAQPSIKEGVTTNSNTPAGSPVRRPNLVRTTSIDTPTNGTQSPKAQGKNLRLDQVKGESLDTTEEDDRDDESLPKSGADEDDDGESDGKNWQSKKERGMMQQERSQELDSPSNAALPILEVM